MGFTKIKYADREVVLPFDRATGAQIKTQLGIPVERQLAKVGDQGAELVSDLNEIQLREGDSLTDVPRHEYGADTALGISAAPEPFALQIGFRTPIRTLDELLMVLTDLHPREYAELVFCEQNLLAEWVESVLMLPDLGRLLRHDPGHLAAIVAIDSWIKVSRR